MVIAGATPTIKLMLTLHVCTPSAAFTSQALNFHYRMSQGTLCMHAQTYTYTYFKCVKSGIGYIYNYKTTHNRMQVKKK